METALGRVRRGLALAADQLEGLGLPVPPLEGKLLRPLVAYACLDLEARSTADHAFWTGALAVQMVHEASLLHDDILDGADARRGRPTLMMSRGIGAALLHGDRLLTSAYRAAALTGSTAFLHLFVEAVERTVAGEEAQGRAAGRRISPEAYRSMILGKSGELFGCVTALPRALEVPHDPADPVLQARRDTGRRLGAVYQMVDDLLDYCPAADSGKPPLQDFAQNKWTCVAHEAGLATLDLSRAQLLDRIFGASEEPSPARRCLARLEEEAGSVLADGPGGGALLSTLVSEWLEVARNGVLSQERAVRAAPGPHAESARGPRSQPDTRKSVLEASVLRRARAVGGPDDWPSYFGRHSRSFRFASWLFPSSVRGRIAAVYAFCRFTDDLVDEADPGHPERVLQMVETWRRLARASHGGRPAGVPLLDRVMGDMASAGVPFRYASALMDGVALDVGRVRIASMDELEGYTWRVASVVGGWVTELLGVHEPAILQRAYHLGHAMQVTNILRDVGEDWRRDRLYLPADLMARHGVDEAMVDGVARGSGPIPPEWVALTEELMDVADAHYTSAYEALPALPAHFRRPVAVAARVYQGIHDEIRRNGYDNGTRRAYTGRVRKAVLAVSGLTRLIRMRRTDPVPAPARISVATRPADG